MNGEMLFEKIREFCRTSEYNRLSADEAVLPELAGMKFYEDSPLFGVAAADDPLFTEFKKPSVIDPAHRLPSEWLDGAVSVLSMFLPYEHSVVEINAADPKPATPAWIHARIEGQLMLDELCRYIVSLLEEAGFRAVCPAISPEFGSPASYVSNWSERHIAYAAGLGTFGLHRGLITEKGTAGRFCSVITDMPLAPTPRAYSGPFDYCTMCGSCAVRCPCNAIFPEEGIVSGKHQDICGPYVMATKLPAAGPHGRIRYGCAKCMSGVPCSYVNPSAE